MKLFPLPCWKEKRPPFVVFLQQKGAAFFVNGLKYPLISLDFCCVIIATPFYFYNFSLPSYRFRFLTKVEGSIPRLAAAERTLP